MTETASQIATEPLDHLYQGCDPGRLEVLGGWDLQCDADERLIVRGAALAAGYAVRCEESWRWVSIDQESGLPTRDRVQLWRHGTRQFLAFAGRDAEVVKVLGELVNLATLQRRLDSISTALAMPPEAALIWALPDGRKETLLVLAGELTLEQLEDIRARFNAVALGFERLGECRQVPALPRTALGKIDRAALGALLARA